MPSERKPRRNDTPVGGEIVTKPATDEPHHSTAHAADVEKALGLTAAKKVRQWTVRGGLIAVAIAVLVLVIQAGIRWRTPTPPHYETRAVSRGELIIKVTATGTLKALNEVDVGSEISGRLAKVNVDYNDRVKKGQVLAELDPEVYTAQLLQAKAQLALARANLSSARASEKEARLNLKRYVPLLERGGISAQTVDAARATLARAIAARLQSLAEIRARKATVELAASNLKRTVIRSPVDGIVLSRNVEPGQTVVAALQAPVLFRLAEDLTHMEVIVDVDEADIGSVRAGQKATFTVAAYYQRDFDAVVTSVRNAPTTVGKVVTYEAVLRVDNASRLLRPGMTATATIIAERVPNQLLVANEALRFDPEGNATTGDRVWVLRDNKPVSVAVKPGKTDGVVTAVTSTTLRPGTQLLVRRK